MCKIYIYIILKSFPFYHKTSNKHHQFNKTHPPPPTQNDASNWITNRKKTHNNYTLWNMYKNTHTHTQDSHTIQRAQKSSRNVCQLHFPPHPKIQVNQQIPLVSLLLFVNMYLNIIQTCVPLHSLSLNGYYIITQHYIFPLHNLMCSLHRNRMRSLQGRLSPQPPRLI